MGNVNTVLKIDNYSFFITHALLLLIYSATFVRVYCGSRYRFILKLIIMLWIASFTALLQHFINLGYKNKIYSWPVYGILFYTNQTTQYTCYNLSHWMFAFEYWSIARKTPYTLANRKVP